MTIKFFFVTILCRKFLSPMQSAPPEKHTSNQFSCKPEVPVKSNQSSSKSKNLFERNQLPRVTSPKPSHHNPDVKKFQNLKNSENFDHQTREREVTSVTGFGGVEYKTKSRESLSENQIVNVSTEGSKERTSNEVTAVKTFVHHYSEVNDKL